MHEVKVNLNTLIHVLVYNGHENLITRALLIDVGVDLQEEHSDKMLVEMRSEDIGGGPDTYFVDECGKKRNYGWYSCTILEYNKYLVERPYHVLLPNGKTEWVKYSKSGEPTGICSGAGAINTDEATI